MNLRNWLVLVFCAGLFAAGVGIGAWLTDIAWQAKHEQFKATVANDAKERALAVLLALEAAGAQVKDAERAISKQREDNAKEAAAQSAELDRLNRCLKSGTCGLRVAAKCPSVPITAAGDSASRDNATGARLDPAAESDYLEFRRKYAEQLRTLRICKTYGDAQNKNPSQ